MTLSARHNHLALAAAGAFRRRLAVRGDDQHWPGAAHAHRERIPPRGGPVALCAWRRARWGLHIEDGERVRGVAVQRHQHVGLPVRRRVRRGRGWVSLCVCVSVFLPRARANRWGGRVKGQAPQPRRSTARAPHRLRRPGSGAVARHPLRATRRCAPATSPHRWLLARRRAKPPARGVHWNCEGHAGGVGKRAAVAPRPVGPASE